MRSSTAALMAVKEPTPAVSPHCPWLARWAATMLSMRSWTAVSEIPASTLNEGRRMVHRGRPSADPAEARNSLQIRRCSLLPWPTAFLCWCTGWDTSGRRMWANGTWQSCGVAGASRRCSSPSARTPSTSGACLPVASMQTIRCGRSPGPSYESLRATRCASPTLPTSCRCRANTNILPCSRAAASLWPSSKACRTRRRCWRDFSRGARRPLGR
mmetsp:Transcript_49523/g.146127  ORF Transcript_49523/g.146127 Transcript_49523/m.146127 type:complete len:214 (-) Transcript_49523:510-1151(-)